MTREQLAQILNALNELKEVIAQLEAFLTTQVKIED